MKFAKVITASTYENERGLTMDFVILIARFSVLVFRIVPPPYGGGTYTYKKTGDLYIGSPKFSPKTFSVRIEIIYLRENVLVYEQRRSTIECLPIATTQRNTILLPAADSVLVLPIRPIHQR